VTGRFDLRSNQQHTVSDVLKQINGTVSSCAKVTEQQLIWNKPFSNLSVYIVSTLTNYWLWVVKHHYFILCLLIRATKCTYLIFIDVKISRQQQLTDHEIIRQILDIWSIFKWNYHACRHVALFEEAGTWAHLSSCPIKGLKVLLTRK